VEEVKEEAKSNIHWHEVIGIEPWLCS
jgi:hypothetical protein